MLAIVAVVAASLLASALTFFTGFGLGTLLLPLFSYLVPVEAAVSLTAVVHLLNNLFKLTLVGRHVQWPVALRFGLPAVVAAWIGAQLLTGLPAQGATWVIASLMALFALLDLWPRFKQLAIDAKYLPLGGLLSGFFGGLSGHQGAFRSAFLVKAGLSMQAFIGTGVVIAVAVDLSRLGVYTQAGVWGSVGEHAPLVLAAVLASFAGALSGQRLLDKVNLPVIERLVAVFLLATALALAMGWI